MKRPLLSRLLPNSFSQSLYYRMYHTQHANWKGLFEAAPLTLSQNMFMYGLVPGDIISGNIAFNGFYELALSRHIIKLARKGGLLVDVGANMGYFSLLWAGENLSGHVVAFEASPQNIHLIKHNISQNGLSDRITLVPKAAGNRSGTIAFDIGPTDQTGWGGIASAESSNTINVPIVRIDQELLNVPIDVLKVDVEGADTWVLYGCEALLMNKLIGTIFFEQNEDRMEQLGIKFGEAQTFLRNLDYTCIPFGKDNNDWMAYPNK
jgi:FkbM family methyltransferase